MGQKKSVRACVAGLVFACALVVTPWMNTQAEVVVSSITVGSMPQSVAINPAGTFAYTANQGTNSVSRINLATNEVDATITVGSRPWGVAINPVGTFAYVVNSESGTVSKIDLASNTVTATITVGAGGFPWYVAINPAGTFAYVANMLNYTVSVINLATNAVNTFTTSNSVCSAYCTYGVAINAAGTFAYVANTGSNSVSKIDLANNAVVATISVGTSPYEVAINPLGTFAYVANMNSGTVSKIDMATDTVVATITVGSVPHGVAINPLGTFAYVSHPSSNSGSGTVSKINLITNGVGAATVVGINPYDVAINPAGTFAYAANTGSNSVSKIALTATDTQSITFPAIRTQLSGAKTVALSASASSALAVTYASATPTQCTVSGSTVTMVTPGDCTINANQSGGSGFDAAPQVSQTFTILLSPPAGEVGASIKDGASYSNSKQVTLNLIWPEYATSARISNDGGFAASKTQTKDLAASIDWELDDSVKGIYTKVVYVRFNGVADTTKTYSDDIILDTTAPTIETSSATVASSSVDVSLKATDDITGVNKVQIRNDAKTVTKDYATKVSVPLADLSLSVSSSGVRKSATTAVEIRVSDNAGNWTGWRTITVAGLTKTPAVTTPAVTTSKSATAKSIATFAKIPVTSTSKVSLKVVSSSAKYCKVSGTTLKGVKAGTCKVTVTVTPKKGRATSKTVTLKVTK